jgi:hypothetical protein
MKKTISEVIPQTNSAKEGERLFTKEEMIGFAEWKAKNYWFYSNEHWVNGSFFRGWKRRVAGEKEEYKTTEELLNLYLQSLK